MNVQNLIETLAIAAGKIAGREQRFSCVAFADSTEFKPLHWETFDNWYCETLRRHSGLAGDLIEAFEPLDTPVFPDACEHRLMWLAWLITMLEEGEEP